MCNWLTADGSIPAPVAMTTARSFAPCAPVIIPARSRWNAWYRCRNKACATASFFCGVSGQVQRSRRMLDFSGQKILVVGGSSGIGLATARLAGELGASVTIASRSADKVRAAAGRLNAEGRALDVTQPGAVESFFGDTVWDHVIVTGSEVKMAAVKTLAMEDAMAAMDSKFWGFYRGGRAAKIRPGGSLGVVAGFLATRPTAGRALMGAINGALESLVQGLALELKPVRVNAISPALVDTEMWHGMEEDARQN